MYIPSAFAVDDRAALQAVMDAYSFATLVSVDAGRPFATHLPLLLDAERGAHGVLIGHVARANPQWRHLEQAEALAIFHGPHAYISPAWYGPGPASVPTWNYVAVHAYGRVRIIEEAALVAEQLRALVERHEVDSDWVLDDAYAGRIQSGVVAFELEISRLEGKFKLSQNKSPVARAGVAAALAASPADHDRAVAAAMLSGETSQDQG
jgi:transcriptional regulator